MPGGFKTRKVAVLGYFNHKNLGDEAILEGVSTLFRDWQIIPMSSETFNFDVVNKCDLFVLGGGELIHSNQLCMPTPSSFKFKNHSLSYRLYARSYFGHLPWVHKINVPKVVLGCGVNVEVADQLEPRVIHELEKFDFIGLRDNASVDILRSFPKLKVKTHLFYDLALAVEPKISEDRKDFAVVVPTNRHMLNLEVKSRDWLKHNLSPYEKVTFIPFGQEDNDDYLTCLQLAHCSKDFTILRHKDVSLQKVLGLMAECSLVLSYRLHGLILAYLMGAKYEFYPYHWKLKRVHDTMTGFTPEEIRLKQRAIFDSLTFFS